MGNQYVQLVSHGTRTAITLGIIALPAEAAFIATIGTFILVSMAVGWILSETGTVLIKEIQQNKGSTIINNYPLHEHNIEDK